nr:MAG: hypothetical protein [Bacteriophage sp.]
MHLQCKCQLATVRSLITVIIVCSCKELPKSWEVKKMSKKFTRADYTKAFMDEVDKLYFNGEPLAAAIDKASNVLYPGAKGRVKKWLKKNF